MRNIIYLIALFLVPFDNLFFAPSSGWATVTPILFVIYLLLNYKKLFFCIRVNLKGLSFFITIIIYSLLISIFSGVPISNIIDTLQTLILGIGIYMALYTRYIIDRYDCKKDLNILLKGYRYSFIYGLIKFIALKGGIGFLLKMFMIIEKRYYPRVAFSFTEPSFIAMHMYGILLVIYLIIDDRGYKKRIRNTIFLFSILAIIASSSTRFLLDTFIILGLIMIYNFFTTNIKPLKKILILSSMGLLFVLVTPVILNDTRIQKVSQSVYSDPSLASRYFRINASLEGYKDHPIYTLMGKGIGGSYYFLHEGYEEAYNKYNNSYTVEIITLRNSYPTQTFCLYVRIISEFGVILFMIMLIYFFVNIKIYKINMLAILIITYLFIQFDSYAFYSIPLILFCCKKRLIRN